MFAVTHLHLLDRQQFAATVAHQIAPYGTSAGSYRFHLSRGVAAGYASEPISRLAGVDPEGTLYVGMSSDLPTRMLAAFISLTNSSIRSHQIGPLWHRSEVIQRRCPIERLVIAIDPGPVPRQREAEELAYYVATFGEAPPWNVRCA